MTCFTGTANFSVMARAYSLFPDEVPFNFTSSSSREGFKHLWHHSFGRRSDGVIKRWLPKPSLNISSWALLVEITRFNYAAIGDLRRELSGPTEHGDKDMFERNITVQDESICDYLRRNRYSVEFQERYFFPLVCILYTITERENLLDLPMIHVLRRLWTLDLLRPPSSWDNWSASRRSGPTIPADAIDVPFHSNCKVTSIRRNEKTGMFLLMYENEDDAFRRGEAGTEPGYEWDHVVLAVPGDVAREIMSEIATKEENQILSGFTSDLVVAVLEKHPAQQQLSTDGPTSATFNYNIAPESPDPAVMISYCYRHHGIKGNHPSGPAEPAPIVASVALNLRSPPYDLSRIQTLWEYQQPRLTRRSLLAQGDLKKIQNTRGISYAGAWTETGNVGWHEDAARSGFRIAEKHLGAKFWKRGVDFDAIRRKEETIISNRVLPDEKGRDEYILLGLMLMLTVLQIFDFIVVTLIFLCGLGGGGGGMEWEIEGEKPLAYTEDGDVISIDDSSRTGRLKLRMPGKRSSHPSLSRKLY
ncbi:hypothetical protein KEM54_002489 [Ascosphaera aggregata]|nr:hypothetical protein KEM54_002489 [Ascosphaera aggregata]